MSAREHEWLCQLEVNLDQYWEDLLRQRWVLREAGYGPAVTPQPGCGAPGRSLA